MEEQLLWLRVIAATALILLVPTTLLTFVSRVFFAAAILEAATLAAAAAYAVYLGVYRYPRPRPARHRNSRLRR